MPLPVPLALSAAEQARQVSVHALSQQNPSIQNPDWHCEDDMQVAPLA
jgi:hypothetical protein